MGRTPNSYCLGLDHLIEIDLDRGGAAKNTDKHLELATFVADLVDHTTEVAERTFDDHHLLLPNKFFFHAGLLETAIDLFLDRHQLFVAEWYRRNITVFFVMLAPYETSDSVGRDDQVPEILLQVHVQQQIAWEILLRDNTLLPTLAASDLFRRNEDFSDQMLKSLDLQLLFNR